MKALELFHIALSIGVIVLPTSALSIGGVLRQIGNVFEKTPTYDYVVIGGGTGGLTIAARLSEDPDVTVAVIEAGGKYQVSNPLLSSTPAGDVIFAGADPSDTNPLVDWNFVTTPQAGASNREIHYARGKCLGGSSARNFMVYQRGTRDSFQKWADLVGDDSYTFDNLEPFFKKSVEFTYPSNTRFANATAEYNTAAFSNAGGPLSVSYANYAQPFSTWLEPALNEIGIPTTQDFNSGRLEGAQYCSSTINPKTQTRESSDTAFLEKVKSRPNLKVYSHTLAKKILFNAAKRATGVEVTSEVGLSYKILAKNEVILSAGAFQSPQLLMVSGIGPAATLKRFKIPLLADRPGVGQNMQDHVFAGPTHRVKVQTLTRLATDPLYTLYEFSGPYTLHATGPLTNPVCDFLAFEKTPRSLLPPSTISSLASFPPDWPEIEYISAPGYVGSFSNLLATQPHDGHQYATILATLVAPLSRGNITITSADASHPPLINPNWLTHPSDISVLLAAYKRARAAFSTAAIAPVLVSPAREYFPGPSVRSDSQLLKTIRDTVMTVWHASCTCAMGKRSDPMAVVDSEARVIGVEGLRVVDASAFALLPPGHPQSMVYALAEKIADGILNGLKRDRVKVCAECGAVHAASS